jgi:hypothetical protein
LTGEAVSLAFARAWDNPEDLVDLGDSQLCVGLVRGHDQVGCELHLIEQFVVLETHVERIHASKSFPEMLLGGLSKFLPETPSVKPPCGHGMAHF